VHEEHVAHAALLQAQPVRRDEAFGSRRLERHGDGRGSGRRGGSGEAQEAREEDAAHCLLTRLMSEAASLGCAYSYRSPEEVQVTKSQTLQETETTSDRAVKIERSSGRRRAVWGLAASWKNVDATKVTCNSALRDAVLVESGLAASHAMCLRLTPPNRALADKF